MRILTIASALLLAASFAAAQPEVAVLKVAGMENVEVRKNVVYDGTRTLDLYLPPSTTKPLPLVVFINGVARLDLKEWGQYTSWPRLAATRGLAAISYQSDNDPLVQTEALLRYVREHAAELHVDPKRIAIWACSANARVGTMLVAMHPPTEFRAAAFYYGAMDTPPRHADLPLLVTRAGLDALILNSSIDRYVSDAIKLDAPITFITYPEGRHAFDLLDDTDESRRIINVTLDFLQHHLTAPLTARKRQLSPATLERMIDKDGIDKTIAALRELRKSDPSAIALQESTLNGLGYSLLDTKTMAAVRIFELVVELNPDSANAHDSLGDAYEKAGDTAKAIAASEKALALLPKTGGDEGRKASIKRSAEEKLRRLRT